MKAIDMVHALLELRPYRQVHALSHYCDFQKCDEFYRKVSSDPYSLHINEPASVPMYMMFIGKHHVCVKSCTSKCVHRLASLNLCKPYSIVETSNINKMTTSLPKTETEYALCHTSSVKTISEHMKLKQRVVIQVLWSHLVHAEEKIVSTFSDDKPCYQCNPQKKMRTPDHAITIILDPQTTNKIRLVFVDHAIKVDVHSRIILQIYDYMSEIFSQFTLEKDIKFGVGVSLVKSIQTRHPGWCLVLSWLGAVVMVSLNLKYEHEKFETLLQAKLANLYSLEFGNFEKYEHSKFYEYCMKSGETGD